jgi:hypothetical protein
VYRKPPVIVALSTESRFVDHLLCDFVRRQLGNSLQRGDFLALAERTNAMQQALRAGSDAMQEIKFRLVNQALKPRRTKLEMPGWAGQPEPRADGSHEYGSVESPISPLNNRTTSPPAYINRQESFITDFIGQKLTY